MVESLKNDLTIENNEMKNVFFNQEVINRNVCMSPYTHSQHPYTVNSTGNERNKWIDSNF